MQNVRTKILHQLHQAPMTLAQLQQKLVPRTKLSFEEEVRLRTDISQGIAALKSQHRAYPQSKTALPTYAITSRGRRSFQ